MKCLLVFDNLNDLIFLKCNRKFTQHVDQLAKSQGLLADDFDLQHQNSVDSHIIMQLFSPLITSQRVMINHFSNAYTRISCVDGLTVMLDDYIGYVFVIIGHDSDYWLKRQLGTFVSAIKFVCGPDISALKSCEKNFKLVDAIVDSWCRRAYLEQSMLVEAIEQIRVDSQVAAACMKALTVATDRVRSVLSYSHVHALIMINHRFLSLYSSRNAHELLPSDIIFLSMVGEIVEQNFFENRTRSNQFINVNCDNEESDKDVDAGLGHADSNTAVRLRDADASAVKLSTHFLFLLSKQKPHGVHISYLASNVPIFIIYEVGNEYINSFVLETLLALCSLQDLQVRGTTDREVIHSAVDGVESGMKKLGEALKKKSLLSSLNKAHSNAIKTIIKKWEPVRKNYQDYLRSHNTQLLQKIDSTIENVVSLLRSLYSACITNDALASVNHDVVLSVIPSIRKSLSSFLDLLKNRVSDNLSLGTKSTVSINKYLEEFPGLVHFLYIDRNNHRFVAPNLEFSSKKTLKLTKRKVWEMVEFARKHVEEGITALIWKDSVFCYSYFLWFEDFSGTPLTPKTSPAAIIKTLPSFGVLNGDFYCQLLRKCFLAASPKVRCFELFCVHLGLVTNACVLEQSRRLTATIWEVIGVPTNPLNLL